MKKLLTICVFLTVVLNANGQNKHDRLLSEFQSLISKLNGQAGLYVRNLKTGETFAVNADTLFPTASIIKIPIAIGLFDKIDKGELKFHDEYVYKDSLLYKGVDILGSFKDGEKIELSKIVMLMLSMSDNTASLWLQHLAGSGATINDWLARNGYVSTRVNSRTPGREVFRSRYGWGQTTPREMANLLASIRDLKVVSPAASDRLMRSLSNNYWDAEAMSQLPPYVQVFSKNGAVDESRSEVALVEAPHGAYVFCISTNNLKDQSWVPENEGWALIRKVSSMLWRYFEPKDKWQPAPGNSKWY